MSEPGRPVTLLVSDLKGSTALAERFDAETLRSVLARYFDAMTAVVEANGGTVAKIIGDAVVAVFDAGEDVAEAARRGAAAGLESQEVLVALNDRFEAAWGVRLENRTGVASGWLAAGDDASDTVLAGEVVSVAEGLESQAPVGGVLIDAATRGLLGELAETAPHPDADGWVLVALDAGARGQAAGEVAGTCPACGAAHEPGARRCPACGIALGAPSTESRRTVTVVFADPGLVAVDGGEVGPEAERAAMARYAEVMRPELEGHGGTVEKFIGDALMAVFGLPVRHEDDAVRATRAAAAMQAALPGLNAEVEAAHAVRFDSAIGVNTGTVVAGEPIDGQRLVTGDAVNVAARLEQAAAPGEVIIGPLTAQLLAGAAELEAMEPLALKGKAERLPAHRLVQVVAAGGAVRRHDLPLVGRDQELGALQGAFDAAVASGRPQLATVVGDAGVGKSRLTHELLGQLAADATVLHGNCLAYGDGITFWPLQRVVQAAAGIAEDDDAEAARERLHSLAAGDGEVLARLTSLLGLGGGPHPVPELVWALRRTFEHLGSQRPLVVVLDDIHWGEPTFLEAVQELVGVVRAPMLVLCTARPAMGDDHRAFVDGALRVDVHPLTDEHCERFLHLLLGGAAVDGAVIARIVAAAAGNPLFLEQLLSMLMDEGRLVPTEAGFELVGDLATLQVPATVEALLAARLDLLAPPARQTIGPAAVIGRHFAVDALAHVLEPALGPGLDERLDDLASRDLVAPEDDAEPAYRFSHALIRDATYQSLLKQARAVLHERFVAWAEAKNAERDRSTEFDEILGYHLEQAHRCWRDLGPLDDHATALGERASVLLGGAGERALARGDMPAAANLLGRAADVLATAHPSRPRRLLLVGSARHEVGDLDQAIAAYQDSEAAADALGHRAEAIAARIEGLRLRYLIGRVDDPAEVTSELEQAFTALGATPDADAASRVWQLQLNVDIEACRWSAAQHAAEQVIDHARRAGNDVLAVRTLPLLAFLTQKGPMPVPAATAAVEAIVATVADDRRSTGAAKLELALLAAMAGDLERARSLYAETRAALADLGWEMQHALVSLASGPIELLADDAARAEAELRRDYEALDQMGERNFISLTAVLLADAVYRQRRFDEAADLVAMSRSIAAPDDLAVQIIVRTVDAKLHARRGDHAEALDLADDALALMASTEDPAGKGDVLLDRAEVLALAGDAVGAATDVARSLAAYHAKGSDAGVARAGRLAGRLDAGQDPLP